MLKGLAKAKALKELKEIRQSKASLKGLALAKALKRLRELRNELGLTQQTSDIKNHRGKTNLDTLYKVAVSRSSGNSSFTNIAKINDDVADKIQQLVNIDVHNFDISIDESAIRHVLKKHGNQEIEQQRGQTAVTMEDFSLVADIVNNADEIYVGDSENTLIFEKQLATNYVVIQEVRIGKEKLSLKTMYKKGFTLTQIAPDLSQSTAETSETRKSLTPLNSTIPNPSTTVNTDEQFLQDIIDGKQDVLVDGFQDNIEMIAERVMPSNEELVKRAIEAYIALVDQYAKDTE